MIFLPRLLVLSCMAAAPALSFAASFDPALLTSALKNAKGQTALLAEIASAAKANPQEAAAIAEIAMKVYPDGTAIISTILKSNPAAAGSLLASSATKGTIRAENIERIVRDAATANPELALSIAVAAAKSFPNAASRITSAAVIANQSQALDIAKAMTTINPAQTRSIAANAVRYGTATIIQRGNGTDIGSPSKANSVQDNRLASEIMAALVTTNPADAVGIYQSVVQLSPTLAQGALKGAGSVISPLESAMLTALAKNDAGEVRRITSEAIRGNPANASGIAATLAAMVHSGIVFKAPEDKTSLLKTIIQAAVVAAPKAAPDITAQVITKVGNGYASGLTAAAIANSPGNGATILGSALTAIKKNGGAPANLHDAAAAAIAVSPPDKVTGILQTALQGVPASMAGELTYRAIITANRGGSQTDQHDLTVAVTGIALKTVPAMSVDIAAAALGAGKRSISHQEVTALVSAVIPDQTATIMKNASQQINRVAYSARGDTQPNGWLEDRFIPNNATSEGPSSTNQPSRTISNFSGPSLNANFSSLLNGSGGGGGGMGAYTAK